MRLDARLMDLGLRSEFGPGKQPDFIAGTLRLDTGKLTQQEILRLTNALGGYVTVVLGAERFEPPTKKAKHK